VVAGAYRAAPARGVGDTEAPDGERFGLAREGSFDELGPLVVVIDGATTDWVNREAELFQVTRGGVYGESRGHAFLAGIVSDFSVLPEVGRGAESAPIDLRDAGLGEVAGEGFDGFGGEIVDIQPVPSWVLMTRPIL
jgi:hypothetical protein